MTAVVRVSPDWLDLREAADGRPGRASSSTRSVAISVGSPRGDPRPRLRHRLDGSLARPALAGPQHWVMYDRDPGLLALGRGRPGRPRGRRRAGDRGDPPAATSPG